MKLFESFGDVLQLSTDFVTDTLFPGRSTFVLSSGSITDPNANIPVADFLRLHPYPVVYLSNQQSATRGLTPMHAALLMMNGTSNIILTMRPSESKENKFFSEKFYSALAKGSNVNDAYRFGYPGHGQVPKFQCTLSVVAVFQIRQVKNPRTSRTARRGLSTREDYRGNFFLKVRSDFCKAALNLRVSSCS